MIPSFLCQSTLSKDLGGIIRWEELGLCLLTICDSSPQGHWKLFWFLLIPAESSCLCQSLILFSPLSETQQISPGRMQPLFLVHLGKTCPSLSFSSKYHLNSLVYLLIAYFHTPWEQSHVHCCVFSAIKLHDIFNVCLLSVFPNYIKHWGRVE